MTEDRSRNNGNVCFHVCMLRSRTKDSAPRFPSQQSTVSHTLPDHTMDWNRTLLWLLIALSIHSTSTFPLFSPLPSISLWGSEGREQGFFFFLFCRWENSRWILEQWFSTLAAYWNDQKVIKILMTSSYSRPTSESWHMEPKASIRLQTLQSDCKVHTANVENHWLEWFILNLQA